MSCVVHPRQALEPLPQILPETCGHRLAGSPWARPHLRGDQFHVGLEKQEAFIDRHAYGLTFPVQPLLRLLVELTGDVAEGHDREESNGEKRADDEQREDTARHLAAQKCLIQFHEVCLDQKSVANPTKEPSLARTTSSWLFGF